jgi:FtsH-binding integral membrane protein
MGERVDVLAFDERESLPAAETKHRQAIALATWVVVAGVLVVGFVQAQLLLAAGAAAVVLGVRAILFDDERAVRTTYRTVDAGRGEAVVAAHEREVRKRRRMRSFVLFLVVGAVAAYGVYSGSVLLAGIASGAVGLVGYVTGGDDAEQVPRLVEEDIDRERATQLFELVDADS